MAFWGIEVKPGKPYTHTSDNACGRLRVSQATLGIGSSNKRSLVQCNVGKKCPVLLCSLLPDRTEYCHLDLKFEVAEEVVFSVIGPRSVHLTGYYLSSNRRHYGTNNSSESYGEDIGDANTEKLNDCSEKDQYEDSFINDGDEEVFSSLPVPSSEGQKMAMLAMVQMKLNLVKRKLKKKRKTKNENEEMVLMEREVSEKEKNMNSYIKGTDKDIKQSQAKVLSNRLVVEELQVGKPDGEVASSGRKVTIHYTGKLKEGLHVYDSTVGRDPFKFCLGKGRAIDGLEVGLDGMRVGDMEAREFRVLYLQIRHWYWMLSCSEFVDFFWTEITIDNVHFRPLKLLCLREQCRMKRFPEVF